MELPKQRVNTLLLQAARVLFETMVELLERRAMAVGDAKFWLTVRHGKSGKCVKHFNFAHPDDFDGAVVAVGLREPDLGSIFGKQLRKTLSPFDQDHGIAVEKLVQTKAGDGAGIVQAIQIHVVNAIRIFVDQGERGARNFVGRGRTQALHDALRQGGFTGAEIPDQQHHAFCRQSQSQPLAERDGFVFGRGMEGLRQASD